MAKAANISIDTQEVIKSGNKMIELSKQYQDSYQNLLNIASSMGPAWEGIDYDNFVTEIHSISQELKSMSDKLSNAGQALISQSKNYLSAQESAMKSVPKPK